MIAKEKFTDLVAFDPRSPSVATDYYWKIYKKYHDFSVFIKVNWAALAFGSMIFLYRRMYVYFGIMLVVEQMMDAYFRGIGFDGAMAHAYGSVLSNVLVGCVFNMLYMRFLKKKSEKRSHIGVHVRLFLPFLILFKWTFGMLLVQFIGIYWDIPFIMYNIYYVIYFVLAYVAMLYAYYGWDWYQSR